MQRALPRILFYLLLFSTYRLSAQEITGPETAVSKPAPSAIRLSPLTGKIQHMVLRDDQPVPQTGHTAFILNFYELGKEYQLEEIARETDRIGFLHIRYQLTRNDIPVLGSVLIAHLKDGMLKSFNGEVFTVGEDVASMPEQVCLTSALDSLQADVYMWQVPEEEEIIRELRNDPDASWYPKGELIWVPAGMDFQNGRFELCYKFNIHAWQPRAAQNIYISAVTGQFVARENMLHNVDVPGKAHTKYSGIQNIITDSTGPYNFRLRENTRGNGIYTFNMRKGTNYGAAVDFTDSNNIWNNVNINKDEVATDAHWGAETTYDYFKNKFNRNSFNNNNARINSYVHYANNYDNAFWDGIRMTYGDGNSFKPLVSLDVCGHEIAHAVTTYSAGLIYRNESGQLNESFSDIFGNSIERFGKPAGYDWKIGEEITNTGNGLRNMKDPRLRGHPRCYKGTYWYYGTGDNGGVHLNSGVQNWWYYLITEGGSGNNDFSNAYQVDSLGILSAEQIAYRNLTVYLTPTSQYSDARYYSIQAAKDLFGPCSREVIAVTNAWYACNVGPKYDSGYVKAVFTADTIICGPNKPVRFYNMSENALAYEWAFGDGDTSSAFAPVHSYDSYGLFTVKLKAKSCFQNKTDSLVRIAYVNVDSAHHICDAVFMPAAGTDSTSKCKSYVYDDGAEDIYKQLRKTNLCISTPGADSIRIRFLDFDYELNYDSLYIYRGYYPGGVKVGGYTGSNLPAAGNWITVPGSVVTLRHISDPYVVGRGFKLYYEAVKRPVSVTAWSDTAICMGTNVVLRAAGSGGYAKDYNFLWKNIAYGDTLLVSPVKNTAYKVVLTDVCTRSADSAVVTVRVRDSLKIHAIQDTLICAGQNITLMPEAEGGDTNAWVFHWDQGLGTGFTKTVSPFVTTLYRVHVSDACTPLNDTAMIRVRVRDPLALDLDSEDTLICFNRQALISAYPSGGDTLFHNLMWSQGIPMGNTSTVMLTSSAYIRATLDDGCSAIPATDSIYIQVRAPLQVSLSRDTTLCKGRGTTLQAIASGGDTEAWEYIWSPALPDTSTFTVTPGSSQTYKVTLRDDCSDESSDSVVLNVLPPVEVSGLRDTLICNGNSVSLVPVVTGGNGNYSYSWNNGLPDSASQMVTPNTGSSVFRVIVNDNCTVLGDTASANIIVKAPLSLKLSADDSFICYNRNVSLTAAASGGESSAYNISWNNGLADGTGHTLTLTSSTWFRAELTDGCSVNPGMDSLYITVFDPLQVSLPADTLICYGSNTEIEAMANGGDTLFRIYSWNVLAGSDAVQTVSPLTNTTYIVRLSDQCSDDAVDTMTVSVMPALSLSGMRDTVICTGGSASLIPSANGGIVSQYQFTWNNGLASFPAHVVMPADTIIYQVTLTDGCSSPAATATSKVSVIPGLKIRAELSDRSICSGDSSQLSLTPSGGVPANYAWIVNGIQQASQNIQLSPLANTTYLITLRDNCSDDADTSVNILVNPLPVADFRADTQVCRDALMSFTNLSTGAQRYIWYFGTGDSSDVPSPLYRYVYSGLYDVRLRAISDSACIAEKSKPAYIRVYDLPVSRFSWTPDQPDFVNNGVRFIKNSENVSTFEWDFGDLTKETADTDPWHTYADTGHYPVRLITRNSIGCADTADRVLHVKDVFRCFIPDAITMNNDNINDSFIILGRGIETYNLKVYNRWGELVYSGSKDDKPFDGRDATGTPLMKGTYIINLHVRDFEGFMHYFRQVLEIL